MTVCKWICALTILGQSAVTLATADPPAEEYQKALSFAKGTNTCATFKKLSRQTEFLLKDLALVRYIELCSDAEKKDLQRFWNLNTRKNAAWLHQISRPVALKIAHREDDFRRIIFYFERVFPLLSGSPRRQVSMIEKALPAYDKIIAISKGSRKDKYLEKKKAWQKKIVDLTPQTANRLERSQWFAWSREALNKGDYNSAERIYWDILIDPYNFSWRDRFRAHIMLRYGYKKTNPDFRSNSSKRSIFLQKSKDLKEYSLLLSKKEKELKESMAHQYYVMNEGVIQYISDLWNYAKDSEAKPIETAMAAANQHLSNASLFPIQKSLLFNLKAKMETSKGNTEGAYRNAREATIALIEALGVTPTLKKADLIHEAMVEQGWFSPSPKNRKVYRSLVQFAKEVLWKYAFTAHRNGYFTKSNSILEAMGLMFPDNETVYRVIFWTARNYDKLGNKQQARANYNKLIQKNPDHWYSVWAHYETNTPLPPLPQTTQMQKPESLSQLEYQRLLLLSDVNEKQVAQRVLRKTYRSTIVRVDDEENESVPLSIPVMAIRAYIGAHRQNISAYKIGLTDSQKQEFLKLAPDLVYPSPFQPIVDQASKKFNTVDSAFIYAIMRQESVFNPRVISHRGARGLLQLMPNTAKGQQRKAGVTFDSLTDLLKPQISIALGASYLDHLMEATNGSFVLTTTGYNGGLRNARKWWERKGDSDYYEFFEQIPFDETRGYLAKVTRNYMGYLRRQSREPVKVPKKLLQ